MRALDGHGAEVAPMGATRLLGEQETEYDEYVLVVSEATRVAETDTYLSDVGSP